MAKDDDIALEVATPNGVFIGTFPKTTKVEGVIEAVAEDQELADGDSFELIYDGEVLQPDNRPLVSFGLTSTAMLELVATGSGV